MESRPIRSPASRREASSASAPRRGRIAAAIVAASAALLSASAAAGQSANEAPVDTAQSYQADRALCESGLSHQDRTDCLREAAAARAAARRGELTGNEDQFERNRLRRCEALPDEARAACLARMRGEGTMEHGSVEEGGIYRERRELVPAPVPAGR